MALLNECDALSYHETPRPGKLEVLPCKPCSTQKDLAMAYSPGVADPCLAIAQDPAEASRYTGRSNLVGVISNGSAVLGLGNIGPLASKPVMEGKGVLFKMFADVDAFDIEIQAETVEEMVNTIKRLEPTFGGINLEDIKAPECFAVEEELKKIMNIPVFHDDQHGTAIISGAALINGLEISGKKIEDLKVVVCGAGAAAVACTKFYITLGVDPANIDMFDSRGHIHMERKDLNPQKAAFATGRSPKTLAEALTGANVFLGLSTQDLLNAELLQLMDKNPIIFACANPNPEIAYPVARAARPDCIMGTGRSDYPNQINNVSGFPYIFRGALDVEASEINESMKIAATKALASLAHEPVPADVCDAYGQASFSFGLEYVIPKPLDPRLIEWVTPAVAKAAMDTGVARTRIFNLDAYRCGLRNRVQACNARATALTASYKR